MNFLAVYHLSLQELYLLPLKQQVTNIESKQKRRISLIAVTKIMKKSDEGMHTIIIKREGCGPETRIPPT